MSQRPDPSSPLTIDPPTPSPRQPLEPTALNAFERLIRKRRSVRRFRDEPIEDAIVQRVLEAGNRAAKSKNVDDLVRLNGEFHDGLAEAGRNTILWDIMRVLRERTSLVFAANTARRAHQDWGEHSKILAAVIDGDEELAAMLATRHVHRAADAAFAMHKPPAR